MKKLFIPESGYKDFLCRVKRNLIEGMSWNEAYKIEIEALRSKGHPGYRKLFSELVLFRRFLTPDESAMEPCSFLFNQKISQSGYKQ